jgi:hypothetical protein
VTPSRSRTLLSSVRESPIFRSLTSIPVQCRCGIHITPGGVVFGVTTTSPYSGDLFRDRVFCSVECIRAFCLESLETLEALDTPTSKAVVSDLHELYRGVAETLAALPES